MNNTGNIDDITDDEFALMSREEVQQICEELVAKGMLRKFIGADGQVRYVATKFVQ
jgi:hypothetical protein